MKQAMTDEQYHATPALSKSAIKKWTSKCPRLFWQATPLNPEYKPLEDTQGLVLGSMNHCLLLEPHKFDDTFIIMKMPVKTRGVKWKAIQEAETKTIVTPAEYELAKRRIDALLSYESIKKMFIGAKFEQPYFWHDKDWDMLCKGQLDIIRNTEQGIVIIDYKTSGKMDTALRYLSSENLQFDVGMYDRLCRAKFGKPLAQFVFLYQSNKSGEEYYIEPKTIQGVDLDACKVATDLVGNEISKRYHEWLKGNKKAWDTEIQATPFNPIAGFYWDREIEILKPKTEEV
jgi:hypothetical protein